MCGISQVPGAPLQQMAGSSTVAGSTGGGATTAQMPLAGSLTSVLQGLRDAVQALAQLVERMAGGGGGAPKTGVMGVYGGAATGVEYIGTTQSLAAVTPSRGEDDAFEARVTELINAERARYGLSAVRYNAALDASAEKHAVHMSKVGVMAHDGIGDGTPGERIRAEGFRSAWGENVAMGQRSPEQVVREWMASPTHRANILNPNFTQLGVGMTTSSSGRTFWAQSFGAG